MNLSALSPLELDTLEKRFRIVSHSIANLLTVIKTLSKLRERDPESYDKLAQLKSDNSHNLVLQLHELAREISVKIDSGNVEPPRVSVAA